MKELVVKFISLFFVFIFLVFCQNKDEKASQKSEIRAFKDTVGFSFNVEQIENVVQASEQLEKNALQKNLNMYGDKTWIAGICPHDDHLLAGRVYVHLFQNLKAKRYVIFGVAHKAANWGAEDYLIFDSFNYWLGPFGPVKVSSLREQIISQLPGSSFVVNNDWQSEEHSVEGIIPFIQYYHHDAEIVSILVPYMNWERIKELSQNLADAFSNIVAKYNWKLGEDISFICSNDGDHYGDQDWGGRNFAPFGTDEAGYLKATSQDQNLSKTTLEGELTAQKIQEFCLRVWGENDLKEYKIRWCGRFAIPMGLNTVRLLREKMNGPVLNGYFLRYDTSHNLGKLPLEDVGLGTTAPNNIRHWVGYSAIGFD